MKFVELNRAFFPIRKGQEANPEVTRFWGHKYSGAIHWPELRQYHRVILLAEASSGKTEEFRNQTAILRAEGRAAFFVRIEELADEGFEAALEPNALSEFHAWQRGAVEGWFFLDSIDEARLNRKSFDTALKNLARVLDQALNRSKIFISCRVSDWNGDKDRASVERILPSYQPPEPPKAIDVDPLLDPIFEKKSKKEAKAEKKIPVDLHVFQIGSLTASEYKALSRACGVKDINNFANAVVQNGLDMFTERPGDVIDLATYWNIHKKFASFEKMTEYAIGLKLREENAHRPDNDVISESKARAGAELIAAALTLGKTFTIRVPSHDLDPSLASGAIDPALVLPNWSPAERNALSRRAVFAPATYGRIRFHHRATQEYLTAKWFDGLLKKNCPIREVWDLIFAERYGVETAVPSLRPEAAWLALWHASIRDEIVKREPLALIRNGDPASLPITTREALLTTFARKQAAGSISNDSLDHRALWMFADARLDKSIRAAWKFNVRDDFRLDLLRLIREGEIYACSDLALKVALDPKGNEYSRGVAVEILKGEDNATRLKAVARMFKRDVHLFDSRAATPFALALFPAYLSVPELLDAISRAGLDRKDRTGGLGYHLEDLYDACSTAKAKDEFIGGIAALSRQPPFVEPYKLISKKYYELAKGLEGVARKAVLTLGNAEPTATIISLLMAVERAGERVDSESKMTLSNLVRNGTRINRALFWADVAEERRRKELDMSVTRHWQVHLYGTQLWGLTAGDIGWLEADLKDRTSIIDRQVALSAIVSIHGSDIPKREAHLRKLIGKNKLLNADLDSYLAPPKPDPMMRDWQKRNVQRERAQEIQTEKNKESWKDFRETVQKYREGLRDLGKLKQWKDGSVRLAVLTDWLEYRIENTGSDAAREWRLLAEGFGQEVAEAYRDGMKILWRITEPEAAEQKPGGAISFTRISTLSVAGIGVEAAEDPDWVSKLTDQEVHRAFLHGAHARYGYPQWMDDLLSVKAEQVLFLLKPIIESEWNSTTDHHSPFLYRYASRQVQISPTIQDQLFEIITDREPARIQAFDYGIRIIKNLDLDADQRASIVSLARMRLQSCKDKERQLFGIRYMALMLVADVNEATEDFANWLAEREPEVPGYGEWAFGVLYERHDPIVYGILDHATVNTLELSLELVYRCVRPQDDIEHDGVFSPGPRDAAEGGRNTILSAIIERPGADAYRALQRLSSSPAFKLREHRFRELARGKAEKDTEFPAWTEAEVVAFQERYAAPVKTGHDLLRVVSTVLADIQHALSRGDLASQPLLQRAEDEGEVKKWLVEQMTFRAKERFLAYKEAEIAFGDKPDVLISSTSAPVEVAMEVKHGGKNWTPKQYDLSLRNQLAQDYLKPANRRHGVFVVSNHGSRTWRDPDSGATLGFAALMARLSAIAETLKSNEDGAIEVCVFGIDAAPKKPVQPHRVKKLVEKPSKKAGKRKALSRKRH